MGLLDSALEAGVKLHGTYAKPLFCKYAVDGKLTKDQLKKLVQEESDNAMMKAKMEAGGCEKMKEWMETNCKDPMDFENFSTWLNKVVCTKYCSSQCQQQQQGSCAQSCN